MSTQSPRDTLLAALSEVPEPFLTRILDAYLDTRAAFSDGYFDACGLRAAKLCETVLRFLQEQLTGTHIAFNRRIANFTDECRRLEKLPASAGHESLRVIVPRALEFLYTLRNKRGVGHLGGDVDANSIDAATALRVSDWVLSELMRFFHKLSLEEAQNLLDALVIRQVPAVWRVAGRRRILESGLDYRSQVLLLLYQEPEHGVPEEDLFEWVEYSRLDRFRERVLRPLHRSRLIEYDSDTRIAIISPKGVKVVEEELLPRISPLSEKS
jgi:hypothetical protein